MKKAGLYYVFSLMAAALAAFALSESRWMEALLAFLTVLLALRFHLLHHRLQAAKMAEEKHAKAIAELHLRTIEALAVAIDAKDNATHQHLERVVIYAEAIGREVGLPESELQALRAASLLHDIGKLAIPEYIISKPGRLTEEEFEKMKCHTVVGAEILERVQFPYPVVPMVRSHHERWDGSGYPDGLKGEEIPVGARILAVVDSFDALSSDRQYRRALSRDEALAVIRKDAGVLFDPKIVEVLDRLYPKIEPRVASCLPVGVKLSTNVKIAKGDAPKAGLSIERVGDTSSALYSIAQAREELQILYELTQALGNSLSVDDTLRLLADKVQELVPFDAIAIYLIHDSKLVPRFAEGVNASILARTQIPLGEGLSGWVAGNGKSSLNGNPAVEPGYVLDPKQFSRLHSALSVPLDSTKGIIGALTLFSVSHNGFTVDHLRILKAVGMKASAAIHNALIHEATGRSAETDVLTGLPNARAFSERVEQEAARAIRERRPYSVFSVDLNGLKQINDTLGHQMGNKVLQAVARALRSCMRNYDVAARMGGDEFALLLPGMDTENAAEKRIELAMAVEAVSKDFPDLKISISMGSASYPQDGEDIEKLMSLADRRMYWHKREYHKSHAPRTASVSVESAVPTA